MLFFRKKEFVPNGRFLVPGVYNPDTSLSGDIEKLSDKNISPTAVEIVNLMVKYFVNFVIGGLEHEKIPEGEVNKRFLLLQEFIRREGRKDDVSLSQDLEVFRKIFYQASMLGCPSTISIIQDIISQKVKNTVGNGEYASLDLGTGSGILQVAFHIKGRRNGLTPNAEKTIGIELDSLVAKKAHEIHQRLGVGKVIRGDTTNPQTYKDAGILKSDICDIGNENLPNTFSPLYTDDDSQEPFLRNLKALRQYFGSLDGISMFPSTTTFWVKDEARGTTLPFSLGVLGIGQDLERDMIYVEEREQELRGKGIAGRLERFLHPEGMKIHGKVQHLEEIGDERFVGENGKNGGYIYPNDSMPRRWIYDYGGVRLFFRDVPTTEIAS